MSSTEAPAPATEPETPAAEPEQPVEDSAKKADSPKAKVRQESCLLVICSITTHIISSPLSFKL
jgi:hypothetical protein